MAFFAIVFLLTALTLLISFYTYRRCFYSRPGHHPGPYDPLRGRQFKAVEDNLFRVISIMERYSFEDAAITAYDGTPLRGRYYHFVDGAPLLILCHGYRSSALRDCCGGHALGRKMGFNILVIHQRCHGESCGRTITFGIRERHDVISWINWANDRFSNDIPIMLFGLSMGAATVLMGCELGYPGNVVCVMADSPYSAPSDIILKVCKDMGYPAKICYPFLYLGALLFGRFRLNACTAMDAVRHSRVPVLLIHGEEDRLVPWDMSRRIAENCAASVSLVTFPHAGHGLSYMVDPVRFERTIFDFLNRLPQISPHICETFRKSMN